MLTFNASGRTTRRFRALCGAISVAGAMIATAPGARAGLMVDTTLDAGRGFFCDGFGCTIGYDFTLTAAVTIKAMGLYDEHADGLNGPHTVALWNSSGTLLTSVVINNSATPVAAAESTNRWLFENIAAITLGPGTYSIGYNQPADRALDDYEVEAPFTFSTFNFPGSRGTGWGADFGGGGAAPTLSGRFNSNADGFFGPNLSTESVGTVTTVPEPATLGLLGLGFVALALFRRRRA
jgi:hypothetical protein